MYTVQFTLKDGTRKAMDGFFDEEWAGRLAHELRRCQDVAEAHLEPVDWRQVGCGHGCEKKNTAERGLLPPPTGQVD